MVDDLGEELLAEDVCFGSTLVDVFSPFILQGSLKDTFFPFKPWLFPPE